MTSEFETIDEWGDPHSSASAQPHDPTRADRLHGFRTRQPAAACASRPAGDAEPVERDAILARRERGAASKPTAAIKHPVMRHRAALADYIIHYLALANPEDAAAICTAYLDDMVTEGPPLGNFGDLQADAALWADCAAPRELEAFLNAILEKLGRTPQSSQARLRQMETLWHSLPDSDRAVVRNLMRGDVGW